MGLLDVFRNKEEIKHETNKLILSKSQIRIYKPIRVQLLNRDNTSETFNFTVHIPKDKSIEELGIQIKKLLGINTK